MGEWKEYKLGEVCAISSSKRIFANEYQNTGIPFYRGKEIIEKHNGANISNELFISEEKYNEIKTKFGAPKKGDMLLSSVGTLGVPYIVRDETFYFKDGNLTWFYNYKGINNYFLYYWFLSPKARFYIDTKAIGSTQKALTIETLKKFEIFLPSIDTQDKIVAILKSLDDKIEVNRKINENLEQQAQALFKSWFVDFEPDKIEVNRKINENLEQQAQALFKSWFVDFEPFKNGEFVESELGMIPKGWRVGKLNEIADITMGTSPSGSSYNTEGIGDVFYQGRAEFGFRFPKRNMYTTEAKRFAEVDTVLVSVRAPVGDINVAEERCCIGRGLASVKSKNNYNSYILYLMQSLKNVFDRFNGEGTVFGSINKKAFEEMQIIVPTGNVISKFDSIASSMDCQIKRTEQQSRRLAELRDTLLPKLMSGELKVNEIVI